MSPSLQRLSLLLLSFPLACAGIRVANRDHISPGNVYVGETTETNSAGEGKPVELRFSGAAGQRVRFRLHTTKGKVLGGAVNLERESGEKVETTSEETKDDDLKVESALLPVTGDYVVKVYTGDLFFGTMGDFKLEFLPVTSPPVLDVKPGAPVTGELTETDRTDLDEGPVDLYRLEAGEFDIRYTFIARSSAFKPRVWVYKSGLDHDPENRFGDAEYTDTVKGDVFIAVAARGEGKAKGPYTLEIRDTRAHELATWPVLELGSTVEGRLEADGPNSRASYRIRGIPGVAYVLDARSADFDVALLVTNNLPRFHPKFRGGMDDNGGGGVNARMAFKFPDREDWVVLVVSNGDDASGAFTLQFNTEDKAPPIDLSDKAHSIKGVKRPVRELHKDKPISARLDAGTGAPKYAGRDVYMFHGAENETVVVTLEARDFDAAVSVLQLGAREPAGAATARKGEAPAKVEVKVPRRADYLIQVEPLDGKSKGQYTLERK